MTRVDWGWVATVALIVWPPAYCALHTIRHTRRAITRTIHNRRTKP